MLLYKAREANFVFMMNYGWRGTYVLSRNELSTFDLGVGYSFVCSFLHVSFELDRTLSPYNYQIQ